MNSPDLHDSKSAPAVLRRWGAVAVVLALALTLTWWVGRSVLRSPEIPLAPLVRQATLLLGTEPVQSGDTVRLGDLAHLQLELNRPAYVYVLNRDDAGAHALLFPMPGYVLQNPLPASGSLEIPGARSADSPAVAWAIGTAGGRERFLILASTEPLAEFERALASLSTPAENAPARPLQDDALASLYRGVTGLVELPGGESDSTESSVFGLARRLAKDEGDAGRIWLREIVLHNP